MNLEPRLLRLARQQGWLFGLVILLGVGGGGLGAWQAGLLSRAIGNVFLEGSSLAGVSSLLGILFGIIVLRAVLAWGMEQCAGKLALRLKRTLRQRLLEHIAALGPSFVRRENSGELATVALDGVEELEAYFSQYLPQLGLAVLVPLITLIFVFPVDWLSGLVMLLTAPLIPLFMVLIGGQAQALTRRQWGSLRRLGAYFLDVIQGLATLKLLGRSQEQVGLIANASEDYRQATMRVLRVAFLSALALELVATLSTAVVAVQVGLRLLYGWVGFEAAFFVLLLAPDFYQPLRLLGTRFHAGMSGVAAARRIFGILERTTNGGRQTPLWSPRDVTLGPSQTDEGRRTMDPLPAGGAGVDLEITPETLRKRLQRQAITFEGVGFAYPDGEQVLHEIELRLEPGQVTALVGASGAGKSSLASLLLGFKKPTQGNIRIGEVALSAIPREVWWSQVAWVPQEPVLFNTNVAENLDLGERGASRDEIVTAAQAAHADEFIRAFPQGYDTPLGERGARLSAGQAQRIALGRAYLKDAPLLILDEGSANLDVETEAQVLDSLRKLCTGRSVLMIAHRLNTVKEADQIVVLEAGKIVETGKHEGLLARGGVYARLVRAGGRLDDAADRETRPRAQAGMDDIGARVAPDGERLSLTGADIDRPGYTTSADGGERLSRQDTKVWARLLNWLRPYPGWVALAIALGVATVGSAIGLMGTSAYIISAAALGPSIAALQVAIVGVRFFGLTRGVFRYLERVVSHETTFKILKEMRVWFYRAIEPLAPGGLLGRHSADLLSRAIGDIGTLENFYLRALSPFLVAIPVALLSGAYLWSFHPRLGLAYTVFVLLVALCLPWLFLRLGKRAGRELAPRRGALSVALVDGVQGLADSLIYGGARHQAARVQVAAERLQKAQRRMVNVTAWQSAAELLGAQLCAWAVLILAIPLVSAGKVSGVYLAVLVLVALASFEAYTPLIGAASHLEVDRQAAGRLIEIAETPPVVREPQAVLPIPEEFDIRVEGLSFAYQGDPEKHRIAQNDTMNKLVLENISFELPQGKRLALVGGSGAGKTTLLRLLLRYWDVQEGEIWLGGERLDCYSSEAIRGKMAVAWQQPYVFSATLRQNLLMAKPDANDEELDDALQMACLGEFVQRLPEGYETYLGEHGVRLSGGEKQRLSLARALLQDAQVIMLDEPAANLDTITAGRVLDNILEASVGRSVLLVSHRLIRMECMDEILVIREGWVVERGRHEELVRQGGVYARMWERG